ncbi:MAG: FlgD immunoglobulin-like domain containing protein [Bacteroidota bacterium]
MMRPLLLAALLAGAASGQTLDSGSGTVRLLPQGALNGFAVLDAQGDVLRAGPRLIEIRGTQLSIPALDPANASAFDPQTAVDARAFTIDAQGDVVVVGLGFNDVTADAEQPPATAAGFALSTDGGQTYAFRFPALDQSRDSTVVYGASTLLAYPATVPQGSAPLDIATTAGGDTLYAATLLAGLRRSTDQGRTWEPVVTPPDSLLVLDPRETYDFPYTPDVRQPLGFIDGDPEQPVFPRFSENFIALSVLVDEEGTVWAGTAGGLNRSVRIDGVEDLAWVRYIDQPIGSSIPSNLVSALEAQPREGRDHIWAACSVASGDAFDPSTQEPGVVVWRGDDAGGRPIFETVLLGVTAEDIAFDEARAYVAASDGLYVSDDDGASWRIVRVFRDAVGNVLPVGPRARAVATTPGVLWVGVSAGPSGGRPDPGAGLLRSTDGGRTFELFRADVQPDASGEGDRTVDAYAYPNPFNPRDGRLRVRVDLDAPADVRIRIYDAAMNLVRTLEAPGRQAGPNEIAWDGQTDGGLRVANGPYIYTLEGGSTRASGRILVIQ